MEPAERIFRKTCVACKRPALTFDHGGKARCQRHASEVLKVPRIEVKDHDRW